MAFGLKPFRSPNTIAGLWYVGQGGDGVRERNGRRPVVLPGREGLRVACCQCVGRLGSTPAASGGTQLQGSGYLKFIIFESIYLTWTTSMRPWSTGTLWSEGKAVVRIEKRDRLSDDRDRALIGENAI